MRGVKAKARAILISPVVRPVEVWAIRAALAWLAVKLGVGVDRFVR